MSKATENLGHLRWKCRRGMLELDVIFERFLEKGYDTLSSSQRLAFDHLLEQADPKLYLWLLEHETPQDPELAAIVEYINRF